MIIIVRVAMQYTHGPGKNPLEYYIPTKITIVHIITVQASDQDPEYLHSSIKKLNQPDNWEEYPSACTCVPFDVKCLS